MGKTLEYDIFDAMVDRLLCPLRPLGERQKTARLAATAEKRAVRKPAPTADKH